MGKVIHYVLILDQSGSMVDLKSEVISSFNEQVDMIKKLQKEDKELEIKLTFCKFNDNLDFKYEDQGIEKLKKISTKDYDPSSTTALYDAIGTSFKKAQKMAQKNDGVFFAIFTDGLENSSKKYNAGDIREIIQKAEKKDWKIKFFCRYEDREYYTKELLLGSNDVMEVDMSKDGMDMMVNEVRFCLKDISKK